MPAKKFTIESLAPQIDRLLELDNKLAKLAQQESAIMAEYKQIEDLLLEHLPKNQLEGATGVRGRVEVKKSTVPNVYDWDALWKFIIRTKSFELVQKRAGVEACRERWADKKVIPGVEPYTKLSIKVSARNKK